MCDFDTDPLTIVNYPDSDCVPSSLFFEHAAHIQNYYDTNSCMSDYIYNRIQSNNDTDDTKFVKIIADNDCSGTINFYDYMNEHLKTYKRFLCDKLPNKTYVDDDIKEICETAATNSNTNLNIVSIWSWNPQGTDGTSDISFTYEEWKTYKKNLNNDSREKQLKYDKKLQYNSKKFEIYSLLIVIPILLFILKKY